MQPTPKSLAGFVALLMSAAVVPDAAGMRSVFDGQQAINDAALDELRGGFTTTSGLQISFGIERVLFVNGELISTTSLNVLNVSGVTPVAPVDLAAGMPGAAQQMPPGASQGGSSDANPAPATGEPATATGAAPAVRISPAANANRIALIQSGARNSVRQDAFSAEAVGTVVQNTLNNQKIQNFTVISATVNSMEVLKTLNLQSAIGSAINDSVRK